ncbi:hypothetical protein OIO90_000292 [Microbotryomycetes sp. JL221]|nr:hypothetical protein OIO90_000292 [Microbotryomycetes sp. JL221]
MPSKQGPFYAVAEGREPGVYKNWESAKAQTDGYSNNVHQKFSTAEQAVDWVRSNPQTWHSTHTQDHSYQQSGQSSGGKKAEAEAQVKGFPAARHKKFPTYEQAQAFVGLSHSQVTRISRSTASASAPYGNSSDVKGKARARPEDRQNGLGTSSASTSKNENEQYHKPVDPVFGTKASRSVPAGRRVFCDGSSRGNGQAGAVAGVGVFWGHGQDSRNLSERLPGEPQTNNRAEMYAVARILETDPTPREPLVICSDSEYTISVFSKWIPRWKERSWRNSEGKDVANQDLIRYILSLLALRAAKIMGQSENNARAKRDGPLLSNVTFVKVKAHIGIEGNEQADRLANEGALMPQVKGPDFEAMTQDNEKLAKMWRASSGTNLFDAVQWNVDAEDLAGDDELKEMERTQDFR